MYAQALNVAEKAHADDPALRARFQQRIDAEEKIEPNDWMPEGYRRTLLRQPQNARGRPVTTIAPLRQVKGQKAHIGKVAHPAQQAVGNAGRAARTASDFI